MRTDKFRPLNEALLARAFASPGSLHHDDFLSRNRLAHRWLDPDTDALLPVLGAQPEVHYREPTDAIQVTIEHADADADVPPASPTLAIKGRYGFLQATAGPWERQGR